MSAFRSRRFLLALALVSVLAATLLIAPSRGEAQLTRCGNEFFYYSDATYSEIVGYEVWDCNCYHSFWGIRTFYREIVPLEYC